MLIIKPLHQRGDTIVEVLLAVAILGLVIALGYSIASLGLRTTRQAQEHAEALKIAEGQLERLKARALDPAASGDVFSQAGGFCLGADTTISTITPPSPTASVPDDFSRYPANCQFTLENQPCTSGYCYHAGVRRGSGANANTFTVTVRWDSIGRSQQDEVKLNYRLYQ